MNRNESDPLIVGGLLNTTDRPLFGDRLRQRDRIINIALVSSCGILLLVTIITLATIKFSALNLLTIFLIFSLTGSHVTLIYWYRLGDLDPKFRYLLVWNSFNLCGICLIAILYYHLES